MPLDVITNIINIIICDLVRNVLGDVSNRWARYWSTKPISMAIRSLVTSQLTF